MTDDDENEKHLMAIANGMVRCNYRVENLHHKYTIRDKIFVSEADPRISTVELATGQFLLLLGSKVIGVYYYDGNRRAQMPTDKWIAAPINETEGVGLHTDWTNGKTFGVRSQALIYLMQHSKLERPTQ
jgi:hypothetical protein